MSHRDTGLSSHPPGASTDGLHGLVRELDAIVWEMDVESERFTFVSGTAGELLGYPGDRWDSAPDFLVERLVHPEDRDRVRRAYRHVIAGERTRRVEHRVVAADGRVVWLESGMRLIEGVDGSRRLCGMMLDISERKRAEQGLRDREARLRSVVESVSDIIAVVDARRTFRYISSSVEEVLGHPPDEVEGRSPLDYVHPDDAAFLKRRMASRFRGEEDPERFTEVRFRHRDGSWCHLQVRARREQRGPDDPVLVLVARDVTVEKRLEREQAELLVREQRARAEAERAEAALLESEERFLQFAENVRDVFFVVSADLSETLYISPAYEEVWGRTCESHYADTRSFLDAVHPDDRAAVATRIETAVREGRPAEHQYRVVRPDGEVRWVRDRGFPVRDAAGVVYRYAGICEDITDAKRAGEALREREKRFRSLIENASDTVGILDSHGSVVYQSPSIERMLGYTSEEMIGRSAFKLVHADDLDRITRAFSDLVAEPDGVTTVELRMRHKDDGWRRVQVRGENRLDDATIRGIVVNTRDITKARRLEEQLRQAQKMDAVGRLAGGVAHDFNNVLTVISGHTRFLLENIAPEDARRGDVEQIAESAERAADLTRQLLLFSRQQVVRPVALDLNAAVTEMERMLRRLIGEDVLLEAQLAPDPVVVEADPGHIHQVIANLVLNARDAIATGGRITIATANVEIDDAVQGFHDRIAPGRYALLSVSDTGTGMDASTLAQIFEPFFTTKEQGEGTGLGLSTVYGIVKQSGGSLGVESEVGEGTTFDLYLPRAARAAGERIPAAESEAAGPGGKETVLIVEDERPVRGLIRKTLQRANYRVLEAGNGIEALRLVEEQDGSVDLVLTDVVMPVCGGTELAERLQRVEPGIPVLFMSGYTQDEVVRRGVRDARVGFLQKPFTPSRLIHAVRTALATPHSD